MRVILGKGRYFEKTGRALCLYPLLIIVGMCRKKVCIGVRLGKRRRNIYFSIFPLALKCRHLSVNNLHQINFLLIVSAPKIETPSMN